MHTIGLDTRSHVDCGLVHLKRRVKMYGKGRVDMVPNQADKQKVWKLCSPVLNQGFGELNEQSSADSLSGKGATDPCPGCSQCAN